MRREEISRKKVEIKRREEISRKPIQKEAKKEENKEEFKYIEIEKPKEEKSELNKLVGSIPKEVNEKEAVKEAIYEKEIKQLEEPAKEDKEDLEKLKELKQKLEEKEKQQKENKKRITITYQLTRKLIRNFNLKEEEAKKLASQLYEKGIRNLTQLKEYFKKNPLT